MPVIEASAFKRHTESGNLLPVYFLYGPEKLLLKKGQQRLVAKAAAESFGDFNSNSFSSAHTVDEIADAAMALPFMAKQKCVLVSDYDVEKISATELEKLKELLGDPCPSTVLIFTLPTLLIDCKKSAKWRSFLKLVEEKGASVEFQPMGQSDIVKFLCSQAERLGSSLSKQNAQRIVDYAGSDLTNLQTEIQKLSAYAKGREISPQDIEELVIKNLETTVFLLSKAIIGGNYGKAYELLQLLFDSGEKAVPILAVLSSAFVDMYRVRAAVEANKSATAPAAYGDYKNKEFRLRNAERDIRGLSTEKLGKCLGLLLDTDMLLKSSKMSDKIIMEELIAKLLIINKGDGKR